MFTEKRIILNSLLLYSYQIFSFLKHFKDFRWWNFEYTLIKETTESLERESLLPLLVVYHCQSSFGGGASSAVQWWRGGGSLRRRDQFWGRGIISPFCGSRNSPSHWREKVANFPIKLLNTLPYWFLLLYSDVSIKNIDILPNRQYIANTADSAQERYS